jgi:hypothetical protein
MAVVARVMAARDAAVERAAYWRQLAEKWADETTALEADLAAARHEREAAVWQATKSSEAASYHIEALTAARQQLDQVREGIAQAIEKHAEECGDPADNAYEYARIARQFDAPARPAGHGESGQITTTGLSAHPLRSAAGYPHVQGQCPACGLGSLFLASGGYLTCASLRCTDPTRASNLLHADAPVQSVASGSVEHSLERKPPDGGGGHTPGVGWMCTGCEWRFSYDVPEDRARAVWLADARHAQNAETGRGSDE